MECRRSTEVPGEFNVASAAQDIREFRVIDATCERPSIFKEFRGPPRPALGPLNGLEQPL
jgi:hypothetical protein